MRLRETRGEVGRGTYNNGEDSRLMKVEGVKGNDILREAMVRMTAAQ